jgi:hypothetical protein
MVAVEVVTSLGGATGVVVGRSSSLALKPIPTPTAPAAANPAVHLSIERLLIFLSAIDSFSFSDIFFIPYYIAQSASLRAMHEQRGIVQNNWLATIQYREVPNYLPTNVTDREHIYPTTGSQEIANMDLSHVRWMK